MTALDEHGGEPVTGPAAPSSAAGEYRAAVAAYAAALADRERDLRDARQTYRKEVDGVTRIAERAVAERDAAIAESEAAARLITEVDDEAADIWRRLSAFVGARRAGLTPAPVVDPDDRLRDADRVRAGVARTRRMLSLAQRGELPFAPPAHCGAVAAATGLICGALAVLVAGLLLGSADGSGDGVQAARQASALVLLFIGMVAGIPVLTAWLSLRHRVRPRPTHIVLCLAGAVVGVCGFGVLVLG